MSLEKSFFTNLIETTKDIINSFSGELKGAKESVTKEIASKNNTNFDIVSKKEKENKKQETMTKAHKETAQLFVETTEQLEYNTIFAKYLQTTLDAEDIKKITDMFLGKDLTASITEFHKQKSNAILAAHPTEKKTPPDSSTLDAFNLTMLFSFSADVKEALEKFFTISSDKNLNSIQKEYATPTEGKIAENRKDKVEKSRKSLKKASIHDIEIKDNVIKWLYDRISNKEWLSIWAFAQWYTAYLNAKQKNMIPNDNILTIVDYSKSNKKNRFFCINMESNTVIYSSPAWHGKNSGWEYARDFSNKSGSKKSSVWLFITPKQAQKANTKNWVWLKLKGLEPGINDNAESRGIYLHKSPVKGSEWCITIPNAAIASHLNTLLAWWYPIYVYTDQKDAYKWSTLLEKKQHSNTLIT